MKSMINAYIKDLIYGSVVGDVFGTPYEFIPKSEIGHISTQMVGGGYHNQPLGTWSDDSSLLLCTANGLLPEYDLKTIMNHYCNWYHYGHWTSHGKIFDCGFGTSKAIAKYIKNPDPYTCGGTDDSNNGNGSLMRILPLIMVTKDMKHVKDRYQIIKDVSGLTHGHGKAIFFCFCYLELARIILDVKINKTQSTLNSCILRLRRRIDCVMHYNEFFSLLDGELTTNTGYVIHTFNNALWVLKNTTSYQEAIITSVAQGEDTDTLACVVGGLAGLYYGANAIPQDWIKNINFTEVDILISKLEEKYA